MAAEYEVNISLNTKKINGQLETLEKRLSDISKAADPLGSGPGGTQRSRNLDRIRATGVIINRLGRELNKLEAQGVKVQNERTRIKRAVAKLDKGLVETARAHVVEIRDFVKEAKKGLKTKEKTVKLDSVQNKFSERRLRALARSNERNEKDLKLNQKMTAEARARMRLLSQSGAKGFDAPRPQGRQMADDIDARLKAQEKSARLANRINELEVKGLNVAKHRKQLGKIRTAQADSNFGLAEREIRVLRKSLELEQSKLRIEQSRLRILREQQKGFAASPVRGTPTMMGSPAQIAAAGRQAADPIRGRANLVGSPAYYEAQQKAIDRLARQGGPSDPVKGHANLVGSPAYYEHQRKELEKAVRQGGARSPIGGLTTIPGSPAQIAASARAGGPVSPVKGAANLVGSPAYYEAQAKAISKLARQGGPADPIKGHPNLVGSPAYFDAQRKATERLARQGGATSPVKGNKDLIGSPAYYEHQRKELEKLARKGGARSPIRGGANMPGSPLARQARNKRLEQVGLGAGFPLLFGGGAGSVIGGAVGGLTGSFGAQIAFSAIGQQIDQFVASMVEAGKAFTSVSGAADFMAEKSLFSSDAMQFRIEKLIEEGQVTEAAALMTQEMAKQVGGSGLKALKDLGTEASKMGKLFNALILQVQAFISRALTPLLAAINKVVGDVVLNNQFNALMGEATGARAKEIEEFLKPFTKTVRKGAAAKSVVTSEGKRLAVEKFGGQVIPEGAAIEPTQLELLRAADTQSSQGEREEARIQKRLGRLEEERKKTLEISRFKDKIAAAEMSRDEQLVIRLKGEQQIAEIEAKRKQDLVDITDQRLIDQININAATEKLAAVRDTERELAGFDRKRSQQRLDDMQKFIEQQYELNEAVKQQAALAEGIAQAMGQGMTQSFDLLVNGAKNWGAALRDIAANVLRDIAKQLIQIYVIEQSIGFLKSFITPFSPSTPLGAGGGQVGRFGTLGPNYGIPQFANGGNPPVGRPSIVGERGPELFVPRTAGTIVPNHAMGGANVTVNVDASGSSVQGDGPSAQQLGKAIGAAVQAELIKQKRPGGLLTR